MPKVVVFQQCQQSDSYNEKHPQRLLKLFIYYCGFISKVDTTAALKFVNHVHMFRKKLKVYNFFTESNNLSSKFFKQQMTPLHYIS